MLLADDEDGRRHVLGHPLEESEAVRLTGHSLVWLRAHNRLHNGVPMFCPSCATIEYASGEDTACAVCHGECLKRGGGGPAGWGCALEAALVLGLFSAGVAGAWWIAVALVCILCGLLATSELRNRQQRRRLEAVACPRCSRLGLVETTLGIS